MRKSQSSVTTTKATPSGSHIAGCHLARIAKHATDVISIKVLKCIMTVAAHTQQQQVSSAPCSQSAIGLLYRTL